MCEWFGDAVCSLRGGSCFNLLRYLFLKLCVVHLVDSHYCLEPSKYISVLLVTLATMVHLELPHVNIFSKIDLLRQFGKPGTQLWRDPMSRSIHSVCSIRSLSALHSLLACLCYYDSISP